MQCNVDTRCAGSECTQNGSDAQVNFYGDVIFTGLIPPTMRCRNVNTYTI